MHDEHRQSDYTVRFDWGLPGARAIAEDADLAVIIDVLSFTTTLSVALDSGIAVLPYRWNDGSAQQYAEAAGAVLAVPRSKATSGQISLSPNTIRPTLAPERLVLPSPNGSTIAYELARSADICIGASLRNATAIAEWIMLNLDSSSTIAVVAAGEKWPDLQLRPAVEDLWGAGAVISALVQGGWAGSLSPEAHVAAGAWTAVADTVSTSLRDCASGRELIAAGYPEDVSTAAELNQSRSVPILRDQVFVSA